MAAWGHFGEILQGRLGADGPVALVTLACARWPARALLRPVRGAPLRVAAPGGGRIARAAARGAMAALGLRGWGGALRVACAAPVGGGAGSSTLAALACVRAVAAAFGAAFDAQAEAALCLAAEGASDPLMLAHPGAALWASRQGRALGHGRLPPRLLVAGGFDGPGRRTDPGCADFADVADLAQAWACAGDAAALGAVATESARRAQRRAPKPAFARAQALAGALGALGVVAAHTGSALGLMFAPQDRAAAEVGAGALAAAGVARVAVFAAGGR